MSGFVHLHVHSAWSLLDGAIPAEELPYLAAEMGYEAVAITDHDALTGAVRFTKACADAGIKPLYGAELTLDDGSHITALAKTTAGYGNLCRLISESHLNNERGKPAANFDAVVRRAEGLYVFSGCARGEVARHAGAGRINEAIAAARRWRDAIGDDYRIEVFDHRGYGHRALRDRLLKVAHDTGIPAVGTNDVHYSEPRRALAHELLHAIKEIVPLSKTQALRGNAEYWLKPPGDMRALFADVPEVADETLRIAEACDVDLGLGRYHFPQVGGRTEKPGAAAETLRKRCYEGTARRFDRVTRDITDRLEHELDMIIHGAAAWADDPDGFSAYFLLVADIVAHTRTVLGIRCACRGSAAGSLVCYVLGISDVDPVRYDLLFERFMNPRREELPDIDVDVESHRRAEVLQHILQTYGSEQTAMCCMADTFRARMAIREVGKALGLPPEEIDVVAKAFPRIRATDIPKAMAALPELGRSNLNEARIARLFELCYEIDGFPRHLALHPSGVILSSSDLADRVPMQTSYGGFTMLQADKHDVEDLGLVKLDVLGVRMLSAMSHAVGEIERTRGARVELEGLAHDDAKAFRLMRTSRTLGCFQIESPGQRDLLARLQPQCFEDLIVEISLFRPGPVKSDMVNPYLKRRHGYETAEYLHPGLRDALAETHGVIVYHEQLIRAIATVTGCSLADADHFRRHLDSERHEITYPADEDATAGPRFMDRRLGGDTPAARWFQNAAIGNGCDARQAALLWKEVFAFASFGFCKAHAAAFALPTYLSSWLKAHYPAEFYAGLLTHDPGMYPRRLLVADARHFGVAILPVDVNASDEVYRVEQVAPGCLGVRLALSEVRDMSETEIASLLAARRDHGPFDSLEDLWRRAELSRPVLENLVHMGALDSVAGARTRRELLWRAVDLAGGGISVAARRRTSAPKQKESAGTQLGFELEAPITESLPGIRDYTPLEETQAELEVGGIDARRHAMELYRPLLAEIGCTPATELVTKRNASEVWVAGIKVASQTPAIRSGQRIIFMTLDDTTGPIDVTIFERVQPWCAATAFHSWLLLVRGELRKRGGASYIHRSDPHNVGVTVVVEEVFDLAELAEARAGGQTLVAAVESQRNRQRRGAPITGSATQAPGRLWHSSGGSAGR
ncbi:MAG: DNA polymerase III subunit alpha [Actinomycetota bacterium]